MSTILVVVPARTMVGSVASCLFGQWLAKEHGEAMTAPVIRPVFVTSARLAREVDFLGLGNYDKVYFIGNIITPEKFEVIDEQAKSWVLLNESGNLSEHLNLEPNSINRVGRCEVHNISIGVCNYIYRHFLGHETGNEVIETVECKKNHEAWHYLNELCDRASPQSWARLIEEGFSDAFWQRVKDHHEVKNALCNPSQMRLESGIIDVEGRVYDVGICAQSHNAMIPIVAKRIGNSPTQTGRDKVGVVYYIRNQQVHLMVSSKEPGAAGRFVHDAGLTPVNHYTNEVELTVTLKEFTALVGRVVPYKLYTAA